MGGATNVLGIVYCATGLLFVALAIPLILRRVKMNPLYGIRLPIAFRSESNWYAINEFGGKVLAVAGVFVALVGLAALMVAPTSLVAVLVLAAAPLPILLLAVVPILRFAKGLR